MAVPVEEILEKLNQLGKEVILAGDGVTVYLDKIEKELKVPYLLAPSHLNRQRAGAVAALGMQYAQAGHLETAMEHQPNYLRLSQAERERQKNRQEKNMPEYSRDICVRKMTTEDLTEVARIEKETFSLPGSQQGFLIP